MQPYSSNTSISYTSNMMSKDGYSDLADHDLQPVYIERPMMTPLQPWMTSTITSAAGSNQQQLNYNQMYNNNNSFLSTPPPITSNVASCMPTITSSPFPPPLVGGTSSPSASTSTVTPLPAINSINQQPCNDNMIPNKYIMSNNNTTDFMPQQQANATYHYSPSPSPTHYRQNSIGSDSSQDFDDQTPTTTTSKRGSGENKSTVKKREKALERNRQAALRCRQRKKEWLNQLQSNVDVLTEENRALEQQSISLREEILNLKTVLLAHRDCSHAHITAASINFDNLLFRPSTTTPPIPSSS